MPIFAAAAKLGAVFAPVNAPPRRDRGRRRRRVREAPAARRRRRARRARRGLGRADGHARGARRRGRRRERGRRRHSRTRRARPARHLLHERQHRPVEGRGAVAPRRTACAASRASSPTPTARHRLHVPAVPHGGLVDRARSVADPPAAAPRARRRRRHAALRPSPRQRATRLYCIPAVWARDPRARRRPATTCRACARPTPERRRHHPSSSPRSATTLPAHDHADLLRLDRGRAGDAARRTRPRRASPGRSASRSRGVDVRLERRRRGLRAQRVPDGRLLRQSRRDRRRRCATAGTTRAISACSTTRATCRSSAGPATCCAPAARRSRPAEVEAVLADHPAHRRGRRRRDPRPAVGRDRVRGRRRARRRRGRARPRRAARRTATDGSPRSSTRAASSSSTRSHAPPPPVRSSARSSSSASPPGADPDPKGRTPRAAEKSPGPGMRPRDRWLHDFERCSQMGLGSPLPSPHTAPRDHPPGGLFFSPPPVHPPFGPDRRTGIAFQECGTPFPASRPESSRVASPSRPRPEPSPPGSRPTRRRSAG